MSFFDKAKAGANKAAAATKRGAEKLKLQGEIKLLNDKIVNHKKTFGQDVYPLLDEENFEGARAKFDEVKAKVVEHQKEIDAKQTRIQELASADGD